MCSVLTHPSDYVSLGVETVGVVGSDRVVGEGVGGVIRQQVDDTPLRHWFICALLLCLQFYLLRSIIRDFSSENSELRFNHF